MEAYAFTHTPPCSSPPPDSESAFLLHSLVRGVQSVRTGIFSKRPFNPPCYCRQQVPQVISPITSRNDSLKSIRLRGSDHPLPKVRLSTTPSQDPRKTVSIICTATDHILSLGILKGKPRGSHPGSLQPAEFGHAARARCEVAGRGAPCDISSPRPRTPLHADPEIRERLATRWLFCTMHPTLRGPTNKTPDGPSEGRDEPTP